VIDPSMLSSSPGRWSFEINVVDMARHKLVYNRPVCRGSSLHNDGAELQQQQYSVIGLWEVERVDDYLMAGHNFPIPPMIFL
jgi:hypothetical protein